MRTPPTSARPASSRRVADGVGEAAGLGDGEVAGVGAGAGDDVAGQLGAGLGHADRVEALRSSSGSWSSVRPRNTRFWRLVMRTSAPSSRWIDGEGPELVGGDVAERGVGVGRHRALGRAADDVGVVPAARTGRCRGG